MPVSTRTAKARVVLFLFVWPLFASRASLAGPEVRDLHLEVVINDRQTAFIGAFQQGADGRISAARGELKEMGLLPPGGGPDSERVDLAGVRGLTATYDERRQRIVFKVADSALLAPLTIDAAAETSAPGPREKATSDTGAVVNYVVYAGAQQSRWGERARFGGGSVNLDARLFSPLGIFEQSAILGTTTLRQVDAVRLDTRYTYTDPETLITGQLGDMVTMGPSWARPIRMGGASLSRDYSLRSDIVTSAIPVLNGTAAAPSTVDVFVDGVKTYSREVPAGPYALTNVPGISGSGNAQVVVRDATGREVSSSLPFFTSAALLKQGVFDYAASVGFARYNYATSATSYGVHPVGVAAARYGLSDQVTLETYNEAGAGLANVGVGASASVFGLGVASVSARGSRHDGATGYQGYASFETRVGPFSISGAAQRSFGDYRDLVDATARLNRPGKVRSLEFYADGEPTFGYASAGAPLRSMERLSASAPGPWKGSHFGFSAVRQSYEGRPQSRILSASLNQRLGPDWSVFASSFVDFGRERNAGVFAGLNFTFGVGESISSAVSYGGRTLAGVVQAQTAIGPESGSYGARASLSQSGGAATGVGAGAAYNTDFGRFSASADHLLGSTSVNADFEGAIVAVGPNVALSRRVEDSFALVKTGVPDVVVSHEGRSVGRTDRWGRVVVPGLFSNLPNRITVDPESLPASASVAQTEATVVPARRSGRLVSFDARQDAGSAVVVLKGPDGQLLGAGVTGVVEGSNEPFTVGSQGRAYMRGLVDANVAVIDLDGKTCRASFAFAAQTDRVAEIGPVPCL